MTRYLLELIIVGGISSALIGYLISTLRAWRHDTKDYEIKRLRRALKAIANSPSTEGPGLAVQALEGLND